MNIEPIAAFRDNYIWAIREGARAIVVDPGDAEPVLEWCRRNGVTIEGIWVTHHHPDHVGGVARLQELFPELSVAGPQGGRFEGIDQGLVDGDTIAAFGHRFQVLSVPGHTLDHIAYFCDTLTPPVLFCGDTLFAGGCGRVFEGTHEQMQQSLDRLRSLPANTLVYCAHEYTAANLRFAAAIEPDNAALQARIQEVAAARAAGEPTVPTTVERELATNPFLRWDQPAVVAAAAERGAGREPVEVFATIRLWKDQF